MQRLVSGTLSQNISMLNSRIYPQIMLECAVKSGLTLLECCWRGATMENNFPHKIRLVRMRSGIRPDPLYHEPASYQV